MTNPFQLGDAVVVAKRFWEGYHFRNHREGRITATSVTAVRVRWCKRRILGRSSRWINLEDSKYQVQKTTDL